MSRRVLAFVLVGVGAFLVVTALGLRFVVLPSVEKAPLDQETETVSTGTVDYLDLDAGELREDRDLEVLQRIAGDVEAGTDEVAVWDYFIRLQDLDDGPTAEDRLIRASELRLPLDRVTAEVVEDADAYGGEPDTLEDLVVKFPFDVQQDGDYSLYDTTLERSVPLEFDREEEVGGLDAYVFTSSIEPTAVGEPTTLPASVTGAPRDYEDAQAFYSDERSIWVEPRTGVILQVEDAPRQVYRVDGEDVLVALDASFSRTQESVDNAVETASDGRSSLRLVGTVLPWVLGLLGLVALVVAGVLVTATGAGRREPEPEPRDALLADDWGQDTRPDTTPVRAASTSPIAADTTSTAVQGPPATEQPSGGWHTGGSPTG